MRWLAAFVLVAAAPSLANAEALCEASPNIETPPAAMVKVVGKGRAWFHYSADLCENGKPYCRTKSYVVPSDRLLAAQSSDGYTCVIFHNGKRITPGWIETARLEAVPVDASPRLAAWTGAWDGDEWQGIRTELKSGQLEARGDAIWVPYRDGKPFPEGTHTGEFEGRLAPNGNRARFDDGSCVVDLLLVNEYLVARDNLQCGGLNVSFGGVYKRKKGS